MAAAMFLIAGGSGLRWGGALEEGGPYVVVRCNSVALTWLIGDGSVDPLDKEEDGDEEEEGGGVMIGGVRKVRSSTATKAARSARSFHVRIFGGGVIAGLSVSRCLSCHSIQKRVLRLRRRMTIKKSQQQEGWRESRAEARPSLAWCAVS